MKMAAIIVGQTRNYCFAVESILKNVIKPNDIDCYFVLTNNTGGSNKAISTVINDCFTSYVKGILFTDEIAGYKEEIQKSADAIDKRIKSMDVCDDIWTWYSIDGTHERAIYVSDEWLKIKKAFNLIDANKYDTILKLRLDIPWLTEIKLEYTDSLKINTLNDINGIWAKEYLFYGSYDIMKLITQTYLNYFCTNTSPYQVDGNNLALVNEVQFGKFIKDNNISHSNIKDYVPSSFYMLHNLKKCKYYKYAKTTDDSKLFYLDAAMHTPDLNNVNIYNFFS